MKPVVGTPMGRAAGSTTLDDASLLRARAFMKPPMGLLAARWMGCSCVEGVHRRPASPLPKLPLHRVVTSVVV